MATMKRVKISEAPRPRIEEDTIEDQEQRMIEKADHFALVKARLGRREGYRIEVPASENLMEAARNFIGQEDRLLVYAVSDIRFSHVATIWPEGKTPLKNSGKRQGRGWVIGNPEGWPMPRN